MKVLLDTNAYIAIVRGDPAVAAIIRGSEDVHVSMIVLGELLHGFRSGNRYQANLDMLTAFIARPWVTLEAVTRTTADRYARIATALRRKDTPLPTNDIWIAAHALQLGADLVSFDRHFGAVDGLVWVDPAGEEQGAP
jgi:predicted nucleic acid-binding protein